MDEITISISSPRIAPSIRLYIMETWSSPCATSPHQVPPPQLLPPSATPYKGLGLIQYSSTIQDTWFLPDLEPPDTFLEHKASSNHSSVIGKFLAHYQKVHFPSPWIVSPWIATKSSSNKIITCLEFFHSHTCLLNNICHHLAPTFPRSLLNTNKQPAYCHKIRFPVLGWFPHGLSS